MTDREALLRAIIENPEDDAPRLVYADWLDEHGEPDRAEFIRLTTGPAEWADRVEDLLARNGDRWRAEAPAARGVRWGADLRRGFVHQAYLASGESFLAAREALFAVPLDDLAIDRITTPAIRGLAAEPRLRRLKALALCGHFYNRGIIALVNSPHVCNLETLYLGGVRDETTDEGGEAVLRSSYLGRLRRLYAAGCMFSDQVRNQLRRRFPEAVV